MLKLNGDLKTMMLVLWVSLAFLMTGLWEGVHRWIELFPGAEGFFRILKFW